MLTEFYSITLNICKKNVPIKNKTKKKAVNPRGRPLLMKKRTILNKRIKKTSNLSTIERMCRKTSQIELCLTESHQAQLKLQDTAVDTIKRNPKSFFSLAKSSLKLELLLGR